MKHFSTKFLRLIKIDNFYDQLLYKKQIEESYIKNDFKKLIDDYSDFCYMRFLKNNRIEFNSSGIVLGDYPRTLFYKK